MLNVLVHCTFALKLHQFFSMFATILDYWLMLLMNLVNIPGKVYMLDKKVGFHGVNLIFSTNLIWTFTCYIVLNTFEFMSLYTSGKSKSLSCKNCNH